VSSNPTFPRAGDDGGYPETMPGFDNDLGDRPRLPSPRRIDSPDAVEIPKKLSEGNPEEAIILAERACEIDPYDQKAAEFRVWLLEKAGRRPEAAVVSDAPGRRTCATSCGFGCPPQSQETENNPLCRSEWLWIGILPRLLLCLPANDGAGGCNVCRSGSGSA